MIEDLLIILFRTVVGYLILIAMMKIMGKREIGQLGLFDALILMSLANITVLGIENYEKHALYWILPVILLTIIQKLFSFIALKIPKFRRIVDGKENFIIVKGKLMISEMNKQHYNLDDLMTHLRDKQIRSISEVEYAVLETNGRLSIFTYEENKENIFPFPLILSGKIIHQNLKVLGKEEGWLKVELEKHQVKDASEVYCASYEDGKLVITGISKLDKMQSLKKH